MPDPTFEQRLTDAIVAIEELLAVHSAIINGPASGTGSTVTVDSGTVPTLLKLTADIAAVIVTGYESGFIQNVADAAGRTAALPLAIGQWLYQRDTKDFYYATALTTGSWTIHPVLATVSGLAAAVADIAALELVVDGKMTKSSYDPNNYGFSTANLDVQVFQSSGTWTKPSGRILAIEVLAIGGGGGGGSGRRGAAATNRWGGGGGGGGSFVLTRFFPRLPGLTGVIASPWLDSTLTVTLGAGGAGAAGISTDSTNGSAGTAGGDTRINAPSVGGDPALNAILYARGGGGGAGGTTTTGTGGAPHNSTSSMMHSHPEPSASGGNGGTNSPAAGGQSSNIPSPGGGGGGGGITSGNVGNQTGGAGGFPAGGSTIFSVAPGMFPSSGLEACIYGSGIGGTGGTSATSVSVHATDGEDGVSYGGGGGGGGAGINAGGTTGAGGDGAPGFCMIITYRTNET